ncbi:MAG: 3-dehydroquinate synthase [Bacteroidales bacterium]|nr:3-dehydroquinate synthase [Bacteroidales bacterium]
MEKIIINTDASKSEILVGERWESVGELIPEKGVVIITDRNVNKIYGSKFPRLPVFVIEPGEESKKLKVVESLAKEMLDAGIDRSGLILSIGGGVVSDIAGFLASIYMRGIRYASVSTTLLSQVDASTGGKNGVNLGKTKNILGCFRQPEFVICDTKMLKTLPDEEYFSGLAELIKTAVIGSRRLFELIENNAANIIKRDTYIITKLVSMAVNFKASVVSEDEKESGTRRILNLGHTYGHAIELFKSVRHGYAVASGMQLAALFSERRGYITGAEYRRIISLLDKFNLLQENDIPDKLIKELIMHDKKKAGNEIFFVFTAGLGKAIVEKIPVDEVVDFYLNNKIIN